MFEIEILILNATMLYLFKRILWCNVNVMLKTRINMKHYLFEVRYICVRGKTNRRINLLLQNIYRCIHYLNTFFFLLKTLTILITISVLLYIFFTYLPLEYVIINIFFEIF